jgi:hypothetical protein
MAVRDYAETAITSAVLPFAKTYAGHKVQRLLGFWLVWHITGGRTGMLDSGCWSRASIHRQEVEFRSLYGINVEDFWPEVWPALGEHRESR